MWTRLSFPAAAIGAAALAAGVLTVALAGPPAAAAKRCDTWPVMLEEFDELSVHPNKIGPARWTAHTPWSGDFGDAAFRDPGPDGPFSVKDGMLAITAAKDAAGRWSSGLLAAADHTGAGTGTRYGYFETRMKMPRGPGTWPAFWLAALKPTHDKDGNVEVDVLEYYGQFTSSYRSTLHVWFSDPGKHRAEGVKVDVPDHSLVDEFHTYGVDISPQAIIFYRDGKESWRQPTPPELVYPMYPLVNLALGSGWPIEKTPNPSVLLVDYVRVYGRDAGPPEGCMPGAPR